MEVDGRQDDADLERLVAHVIVAATQGASDRRPRPKFIRRLSRLADVGVERDLWCQAFSGQLYVAVGALMASCYWKQALDVASTMENATYQGWCAQVYDQYLAWFELHGVKRDLVMFMDITVASIVSGRPLQEADRHRVGQIFARLGMRVPDDTRAEFNLDQELEDFLDDLDGIDPDSSVHASSSGSEDGGEDGFDVPVIIHIPFLPVNVVAA
jgi:hypothetical protein